MKTLIKYTLIIGLSACVLSPAYAMEVAKASEQDLFELIKAGAPVEEVEVALKEGADVDAVNERGWTPLHCAAEAGQGDVCRALIEKGVVIDAKERSIGCTPLHRAGGADVCRLLLEKGADLEAKNFFDATPLYYAGLGDVCRVLIEAGADVHAKSSDGWTPLHCAASNGRADSCRLLIEAGVDVNAVNERGTALHRAAEAGHGDVCRLLIEKGADVDVVNARGWTPLHCAAGAGLGDVCRALIEKGVVMDAKEHNAGWTPLHCAARAGLGDVCRLLIEKEVDMDTRDGGGNTPLHRAVRAGHADVCRLLIEMGADVHAKNSDGWTPLHSAAGDGHADVCRRLLGHMLLPHVVKGRSSKEFKQGLVAFAGVARRNHNDTLNGDVRKQILQTSKILMLEVARSNLDAVKEEMRAGSKYAKTDEMKALLNPDTLEERLASILGLETESR